LSILKKLAGQTAVYGISSIFGRFLNYLLVPVYTRIFLDTEYGVVTELYAYVAFFTVLYTYGMETAYFRFSEKEKKYDAVFSTAFLSIAFTTVLLTGVFVFFSKEIAARLHYPGHPEYIIWFTLILAFDSLSAIPFARIRQKGQPLKFAAIRIINIVANIGFNLFFLVFCPWAMKQGNPSIAGWVETFYNPQTGVGYVFISNLIASGIMFLLTCTEVFKHRISFNRSLWKEMVIYALPLLVVGFAGIIDEMTGRAMLKWLLPGTPDENLAQLGIYGACYKLAMLVSLFTQAFRYAAEPFFFSQAKEANAPQTFARVTKYFIIAGCLMFLVIMFYIDVAKYFIGENFRSGLKVVPVLLWANVALGAYYNLSVWYKLTDKTITGAYISIAGAVVTIALNVALIPLLGYIGSAWSTLACYVFMAAVSYFLGQRYYPIPYEMWKIFAYIVSALLLYWSSIFAQSWLELNEPAVLALNSGLLIVFLLFLWKMEFKKPLQRN